MDWAIFLFIDWLVSCRIHESPSPSEPCTDDCRTYGGPRTSPSPWLFGCLILFYSSLLLSSLELSYTKVYEPWIRARVVWFIVNWWSFVLLMNGSQNAWGTTYTTLMMFLLILHEKRIELNLSGNEVYYTACSLLVTFKSSCSKFHYLKGLNLNSFSYKITIFIPLVAQSVSWFAIKHDTAQRELQFPILLACFPGEKQRCS